MNFARYIIMIPLFRLMRQNPVSGHAMFSFITWALLSLSLSLGRREEIMETQKT